ncbi:MAG TPA: hypothetical protein ENI88_08910 [Desulfobulbus sp.]|nr:hypothetical protein [Desulfobulbus sp.]
MTAQKTILMLGDSLVEWGDWDTLLPDYKVLNRGVAGEDVEGLSVRLADEVAVVEPVQHILIMAGTNNLLMGNLFFPAIFRTMLVRLQQLRPDPAITVNSILPMDIPGLPGETIDRVNLELRGTTEDSGSTFLDMDEAYAARCLPITHPCFMEDGVHLSTRGYQVWAEEISRHLQGLEREP